MEEQNSWMLIASYYVDTPVPKVYDILAKFIPSATTRCCHGDLDEYSLFSMHYIDTDLTNVADAIIETLLNEGYESVLIKKCVVKQLTAS